MNRFILSSLRSMLLRRHRASAYFIVVCECTLHSTFKRGIDQQLYHKDEIPVIVESHAERLPKILEFTSCDC